ncbi:MAG: ABC transporter substrate-binding protein [Candidatus Polarisedimenticolia bacterium]
MSSRPALAVLLLCAAACASPPVQVSPEALGSWDDILAAAKGGSVTWAMWMGDPAINDYVRGWVAPELERRHGVRLQTVSAQGPEIVSMMMTEIEAGKPRSEIDLFWINGETFYQLRQIGALWGPFTDRLPNARLIDFQNPFISRDFQQQIEGYECPWGNVQLALIYDSARVQSPPGNLDELESWVRLHPGRFTFDTTFTGLTFLKSLLIDIAGGPASLHGPFDEAKYAGTSGRLWERLDRMRPFFWKEGRTFPSRLAEMHQLFASGEIDFTMSNNDGEVDNKVMQGLFPDTARAYVLRSGTIQNSHYVGISRRSAHHAAALVAVNFLVSEEAQFEKLKPDVWGDGTVLDTARLGPPWDERFRNVPRRNRAPAREQIQPFALQELAPEYMIRLNRDLRTHLIDH